jgi:hypothetical protein
MWLEYAVKDTSWVLLGFRETVPAKQSKTDLLTDKMKSFTKWSRLG